MFHLFLTTLWLSSLGFILYRYSGFLRKMICLSCHFHLFLTFSTLWKEIVVFLKPDMKVAKNAFDLFALSLQEGLSNSYSTVFVSKRYLMSKEDKDTGICRNSIRDNTSQKVSIG